MSQAPDLYWNEEFPADQLAVVARLRSRFRGALLGLALGESLAAPAQFLRRGVFAPIKDLLGGGPFDLPPGAWADDTALALHLARSLLAQGGCDPLDQLERYQRWQREGEGSATGECLGISASTSRALAEGAPSSSIADGAEVLSRVAPLALWHYADEPALLKDVTRMAGVTTHDPATGSATAEFAQLVLRALRGTNTANLLPVDAFPAGGLRESSAASRMLDEVRTAMHGAQNWKDAVLRAVNEGGDADVRAAATGQLAGALFGAESIPASWLDRLTQRDAIVELADALLAEVLVRFEAEG